MPQWGKADQANNAPKFPVVIGNTSVAVYGNTAFSNTTVGAFIGGIATGVFAANTSEIASVGKGATPGWVKKTSGTGPVGSVSFSAGGASYLNTNVIRISGGTSNATGTVTTNSSGGLTAVTLVTPGAGFINVANTTAVITNATGGTTGNGTGAVLTFTLAGRAGRVNYETLATFKNVTGANTPLT